MKLFYGINCELLGKAVTENWTKQEIAFGVDVYTLNEVKRLLRQFGLNVVATYNSTSKAAFKLGDSQICIVTEKM